MRKIVLFLLLVPALILTACKTNAATPEATATPQLADCQLTSSIFPAPKDASAATYAPITSSDWVKGPADATLTVIEYSDFT